MLCLLVMSARGDVYMEYRIGPRTEPWGTPQKRLRLDEHSVLIFTNWVLPDKQDCIQPKAFPVIPKRCFSLVMRTSWSIVSDAAERSSNTNITHSPSSRARRMSLCTRVSTVSCTLKEDASVHFAFLFFGLVFSTSFSGNYRIGPKCSTVKKTLTVHGNFFCSKLTQVIRSSFIQILKYNLITNSFVILVSDF